MPAHCGDELLQGDPPCAQGAVSDHHGLLPRSRQGTLDHRRQRTHQPKVLMVGHPVQLGVLNGATADQDSGQCDMTSTSRNRDLDLRGLDSEVEPPQDSGRSPSCCSAASERQQDCSDLLHVRVVRVAAAEQVPGAGCQRAGGVHAAPDADELAAGQERTEPAAGDAELGQLPPRPRGGSRAARVTGLHGSDPRRCRRPARRACGQGMGRSLLGGGRPARARP